MHSDNSVVTQLTKYKFLCLRSAMVNNYKFTCCKDRIAHADWHIYVNIRINKIHVCVEYISHDYFVCKTICELCDIRDGVKQYDYLDNINNNNTLFETIVYMDNKKIVKYNVK